MAKTAVAYTDNAHKFREVIGKRIVKALTLLDGIARGADTAQYTRTPEQVAKMIADLKRSVEKIENAYKTGKVGAGSSTGYF